MPFDKEAVAHRMKVFRAENRMSQQDLADATGLNIGTIARYETAESGMTLESAWKIADVFGIELDELAARPKKSPEQGW